MAREPAPSADIRAFADCCQSIADQLQESADRMEKSGVASILIHRTYVDADSLPRLMKFAGDVLAVAVAAALSVGTGQKTHTERMVERAAKQKLAASAKQPPKIDAEGAKPRGRPKKS